MVTRGLAVDPRNVELLELHPLIEQSMKKPWECCTVLKNGVIVMEANR